MDIKKINNKGENRMKTYKIIHTEKLIGWFYVDAENEESAIKEIQ